MDTLIIIALFFAGFAYVTGRLHPPTFDVHGRDPIERLVRDVHRRDA